ncbi:TNFAIP3-interacting protein 1-like [Gigantopelta aegis]|uniref:TNFAIP3-interacting protein 1-like n=1 Tax=Gigantopelta aegis TaxID=1735272 RepID=UPI001B88AB7D|nr:TNFAIP3-interacting protein 1-like [Gigantopelta aegis]XP_041364459.1 TNFAIP3-interacting protein 1-like [Gigantopelta aegis]XP_041364460.1 TNFAIP3-interacting protein 1-like [Gigantopelta aegis]
MFEVGSDNLDQYNPDLQTSASSDVATSTSTKQPLSDVETTASANITTTDIQLLQQIEHLQKENRNLQGRIRGYTTLGSLLQEEKDANRKLSKDFEELKKKLTVVSISTPQNLGSSDETRVESLRNFPSMKTHLSLTTEGPVENDVTQHEPSKPTDPPPSPSSSEVTNPPPSPSREVIPMQESMHDKQNDLSELAANPSMSLTDPLRSGDHHENIDANLQLDSDRFEEPEYEKVGRLSSTFLQVGFTGTPTSDASITAQKYSFPSLNSGTSHRKQNVSEGSLERNDLYKLTSYSEAPTSLGVQVSHVANMLVTSDDGPQLATKLRQLSDQVAKQEQELVRHKKLNATLCEENRRLQTSKRLELHEEKSKNYQLRAENSQLETRVRELEHHQQQMNDSLTTPQGWEEIRKSELGSKVDVELFQNTAATLPSDASTLTQMVQELQNKNKQLKDANNSWRSRWTQLESSKDSQIKSLENQLAGKTRELSKISQTNADREREFEQMLCAAKSHAGDEENAKEEALQQLHVANTRLTELQEKIASLEWDNKDLVRAKHTIEAELTVLKKEAENPQAGRHPAQTVDALKTEIAVLREQLTVFEEDFERERQDRAATQSAREDIQTKYEEVYRSRRNLSERLNNQQRKAEHLETELRQTQRRIQNLETENRRLKAELKQQQAAMRYAPPPPVSPYPPQPFQQYPYGQVGYYQPGHLTQQIPLGHGHTPLEHLPGAWTCSQCTFVNIAERTVCDMCGVIRQRRGRSSQSAAQNANPEAALMSRGRNVPDDSSDLVTDDVNDLVTDDGQFK